MVITRKVFDIISGMFFASVILMSAYSLVPTVSRELDSKILGAVLVVMVVGVSCVLSSGFGRLEELSGRLINGSAEKADGIFCLLTGGLLVLQTAFVLFQDFTPKNDLLYVCQGAENLVTGNPLYDNIPEIHRHYFSVYPNNHMLFTVIYGLYKAEYLFTGNITNTLPVIFNIISLNLSYILMYKTARLMYTPEKSLVCAVRGLMFTPLITYAAFFYTDSMSMPWITGALYLYMKWRTSDSDSMKKDIFNMALCGMILAIAYKLKGSAVIFIPAVIADMIFCRRKNSLINFSVLMTVFVIFCIVLSGISKSIIGVDCAELERYRFPLVHWVMMSADGRGGYCAEDFRYTLSFNGYDSKINADICRLSEKLSAEGVSGFFGHLFQKLSYTWRDGTYMAGYYNKYGFLRSYGFYIFTALCHFTMMSGIVRRYVSGKDKSDCEFMPKIMLVGLAVFLMIWETRCRYLVSFFALFALI